MKRKIGTKYITEKSSLIHPFTLYSALVNLSALELHSTINMRNSKMNIVRSYLHFQTLVNILNVRVHTYTKDHGIRDIEFYCKMINFV